MRREVRWLCLVLLALCVACGDSSSPSDSSGADENEPATDDAHASASGAGKDAGKVQPQLDAGKAAGPGSGIDAGSTSAPKADASSVGSGDAGLQTDAGSSSASCDRACLVSHMDRYLTALTKKDTKGAPFASSLRYTENGVEVKLGDGLWKTAASYRKETRLDFADPVTANAGVMVVVLENGTTPVLYLARLKVVKDEISELETMAVRQAGAANGFFSPDNMVPKPVFLQAIPADKRMTRAELQAEVDLYVDFLDGGSGEKVHFDSMCTRFENGVMTAAPGAVGSQSWNFDVTRRYPIIDEEAGIVWGMLPFSQSDTALVVGEAFKVIDKKIMMIQAVMANMPAKAWK